MFDVVHWMHWLWGLRWTHWCRCFVGLSVFLCFLGGGDRLVCFMGIEDLGCFNELNR